MGSTIECRCINNGTRVCRDVVGDRDLVEKGRFEWDNRWGWIQKKGRFNFERTLYYIMIVVVNKSFISDR